MPWISEELAEELITVLENNQLPTWGRELATAIDGQEDSYIVRFTDVEQINRTLLLIHRDLARVMGEIQIAQERLSDTTRLSGRMRKKAQSVLESAPRQEAVLRAAQEAMRATLRDLRSEGVAV